MLSYTEEEEEKEEKEKEEEEDLERPTKADKRLFSGLGFYFLAKSGAQSAEQLTSETLSARLKFIASNGKNVE